MEIPHASVNLSSENSLQSSGIVNDIEMINNGATFDEKDLLEDLESYMEDLNERLTISRMVSDSVIKGMVSAISEEADEKVASKEAEVALLNERLHFFESNTHGEEEAGSGILDEPRRSKGHLSIYNLGLEQSDPEENLGNLKIAAEEQFQRLQKEIEDVRGCNSIDRINVDNIPHGKMSEKGLEMIKSLTALKSIFGDVYDQIDKLVFMSKVLLPERQWELEFQEQVDSIIFQSIIWSLKEDFEEKSQEQRYLFDRQNKNLITKIDELSTLREELDAFSRSLVCPELGKLSSHGSYESVEEWSNIEKKDPIHRKVVGNHLSQSSSHREENGTTASEKSEESKSTSPETTDSSLLVHMKKEEIISYFNTEMTKLKRNHESTVQEKTEEYYRLKREFLKEEGSSHARKGKEFEALRKRIVGVIKKLDDVLAANEKPSMVCDEYEYDNKERFDKLHIENQHLHAMLVDERKKAKCLLSQVSDAADKISHLSVAEANFLEQIKKLKCDIEDLNVEVFIREEIHKSMLRELISKINDNINDADIHTIFMNEISMVVFRESVRNAEASTHFYEMKYNKEKEKRIQLEIDLYLVFEEKEKLLHEKARMSTLMEEKNKLALEEGSKLTKQKEHFQLICKERGSRLEEALKQIDLCKEENSILDQKLKVAMDKMRFLEGQNSTLHGIIQENQSALFAAMAKELEQKKQIKSFISSIQELSEAVVDCEQTVTKKIIQNNVRLDTLSHLCSPLVQRANLLKKKGFVYKQRLEVKCSNLEKAELEVDRLGDELDELLSLLGKIYIGLDHYSHVLMCYPGIMETLELVRRAVEGETTKPA